MPIRVFTMKDKEIIGQNEEVKIYYSAKTDKLLPPIIGLHGNWATNGRYEKYGRFFASRGFLFVAPTYRHHYPGNCSDKNLGKTSIRDYARDIVFLLKNLRETDLIGIQRFSLDPIVIGHSMGGLVAQLVASEIPLSGLVLLNSAPPAGVSLRANKDYKYRIKKYFGDILLGRSYLPDFESMSLYVYNGMPREMHKGLYSRAVCESGTATREILAGSANGLVKFIARLFSKPIKINPQKVKCPVLIIGCGKDRIIPQEIAKDIFSKYSKCSLRQEKVNICLLPSFAHWAQYEPGWEKSALVILNTILSEWLK